MLRTENCSPDSISDGIRLDKSDGNSEGFIVVTSDGETPGAIDNTMICVADSSKLGKELGFGINESDSEIIKGGGSLGLKNNIIDGDELLTT